MSNLDPRIEVVRKKYGLQTDDFWKLPQGRDVWLVKHAALEVVAAKEGIAFDPPIIIEADGGNGVAAVCVTGNLNDRAIWSIGEASPKNSKNGYPWAMAEKRAIDRVILKLVGIHGLVFSDAEGDFNDTQAAPAQDTPPTLSKAKSRDLFKELQAELDDCGTVEKLAAVWLRPAFQAEFKKLPADWSKMLTAHKDDLKVTLQGGASEGGYVPPVFDKENA